MDMVYFYIRCKLAPVFHKGLVEMTTVLRACLRVNY